MGKLREELEAYTGSGMLPFHMPGHKRQLPGELSRTDVTELPATDDLHAPEGILKEAQTRAAKLYGAEESYYLVGGSSAGVLAALSAGIKKGGTLLMQRASHKSAYHAIILRELKPVYLPEDQDGLSGAGLGVNAEDLERTLDGHPEAGAVFLTSPGYEGFSGDLREAAELCHERGIPLIVDAAHGAHFGFHPYFPESAVQAGADLVVMSVHKTLPAPTQTALLHRSGNLVSPERLRSFLAFYQSSSPSYPLMAAIDDCMDYLEKGGTRIWEEFLARRRKLDERLAKCRHIRTFTPEPCKLLLCPEDGRSGLLLASGLRGKGIEAEMALPSYVLLICSVADTEVMYERLAGAVEACDQPFPFAEECPGSAPESFSALQLPCVKDIREALPMHRAWEAEREYVPFASAEKRIAADFVMVYPPGQPILVPGECITAEVLSELKHLDRAGCVLQGVKTR